MQVCARPGPSRRPLTRPRSLALALGGALALGAAALPALAAPAQPAAAAASCPWAGSSAPIPQRVSQLRPP